MQHLCYYKLDIKLPKLDKEKLKGTLFRFLPSSYYSFHIKDLNYYQDTISKNLKFVIEPDRVFYTEIIADNGLYPHIDENDLIGNYYIDAADCKTLFYDLRDKNNEPTPDYYAQTSDLKKSRNFDIKELKLIDSFIANDEEFYFINSRKIHNVYRYQKGLTRSFLRWEWDSVNLEQYLNKLNG